MTSSAIDKKLEINKKNHLEIYKNLETKLKIYKNLENKLKIYSYFKLEIFEFIVNGRWTQYKSGKAISWRAPFGRGGKFFFWDYIFLKKGTR